MDLPRKRRLEMVMAGLPREVGGSLRAQLTEVVETTLVAKTGLQRRYLLL